MDGSPGKHTNKTYKSQKYNYKSHLTIKNQLSLQKYANFTAFNLNIFDTKAKPKIIRYTLMSKIGTHVKILRIYGLMEGGI